MAFLTYRNWTGLLDNVGPPAIVQSNWASTMRGAGHRVAFPIGRGGSISPSAWGPIARVSLALLAPIVVLIVFRRRHCTAAPSE